MLFSQFSAEEIQKSWKMAMTWRRREMPGLDPAPLLPWGRWLGLDGGQRPRQGGIGAVPAPDSFVSQRRIFAELEMSHQVINYVPRYADFPGLFGAE